MPAAQALRAENRASQFRLAADGSLVDETGRHQVTVHPDASMVAPSELTAPDGSRGIRFDGGWLEVTNALPESASDFELAAGEDVRLSFWFLSDGNGEHLDGTFFADRMHALGLARNP